MRLNDYPQPTDAATSHAQMTAFNLMSERHTPRALVRTDKNAGPGDLPAQATELVSHLATRRGTDLGEALSLGRAAGLLTSITSDTRDPP